MDETNKIYVLQENINGKLNIVTPFRLKQLKKLELWDTDKSANDITTSLARMYVDEPDKLKEFVKILFTIENEDKADWDEINLGEVVNGYFDFFLQLTGRTLRLMGLDKTLNLS